jgi:hypothetical protein
MQKNFFFSVIICIIFISCQSPKNEKTAVMNKQEDELFIFPVTSYLKGQLKQLDSMEITPLKVVTSNGQSDSVWLDRSDIRMNATLFLSPNIDSSGMAPFYSEKSFLDQTINAVTFSYDPKTKLPDSLNLTHWDVYINPQTSRVERIYLVKESEEQNVNVTTQLTWLSDKWFSIRTIKDADGKPEVKETKIIWGFD